MNLDDLKKLAEAIGVVGTILNALGLGFATWLLGTVTSSPTSQGYIRIFALLGAVAGFWFTFTGSAGKGRNRCLRRRTIFAVGLVLACALGIFTLSLTEGELAVHLPTLEPIRNFLLDINLLANVLVGMTAGAATYLLFGAIVLSYPKMWDMKL